MSSYTLSVRSSRTMVHIETVGRAAFDRDPHAVGRATSRLQAGSSGGQTGQSAGPPGHGTDVPAGRGRVEGAHRTHMVTLIKGRQKQ